MVRVVDCQAGVLGSNPGGPKIFSPWNYFRKYVDSLTNQREAINAKSRLAVPGTSRVQINKLLHRHAIGYNDYDNYTFHLQYEPNLPLDK